MPATPPPRAALAGGWVLGEAGALVKVAGVLAPGTAWVPPGGRVRGRLHAPSPRGPFGGPSYAKRVVFGTRSGPVAAYKVYFIKSATEAWETIVDGTTGRVLYRASVVHFEGDPQGTVYDNYPGAARGGQPRQHSFGATPESPKGWVDPTGLAGTGVTTLGNNADAYANWSNFIGPVDNAPRPVSPTGNFSYVFKDAWAAEEGRDASRRPTPRTSTRPPPTSSTTTTGSTTTTTASASPRPAGNFQLDNGGKGGLGGDAIRGLVQAGAASGGAPTYTGRDNAYMLTLDDGIPPWSGMFLWEPIDDAFEGPHRDGSFDMTVIQHEYSHGLSNRYVAGGGALGSHQAGSMGEGWGDWYALNHAQATGLEPTRAGGRRLRDRQREAGHPELRLQR